MDAHVSQGEDKVTVVSFSCPVLLSEPWCRHVPRAI